MKRYLYLMLAILLCWPLAASAQEDDTGQVTLPLELYQQLLEESQTTTEVSPTPGYALGNATMLLTVSSDDERRTGVAIVTMTVEVYDDGWVLVPVLPAGTAVTDATVRGRPMQLISSPIGMVWAINSAGTYDVQLQYQIDASSFEDGYSLAMPVPQSSSVLLQATIPGIGLGVAVIPSTTTDINESGTNTHIRANIASTNGIQITWRTPRDIEFTMSRATYRGELNDNSVTWTAEFAVEMPSSDTIDLQLLSDSVALLGITVDGDDVPITTTDGLFTVAVQGSGQHLIIVEFQVPVGGTPGRPRVDLTVPRVPVSLFELTLEGEKEVTVLPASSVTHELEADHTTAIVHVPMTDHVAFSWLEAVPEALAAEEEVRANAAIYHAVHADEGVLQVHAFTIFEVTRGETSQFEFIIPEDVQINRIESASGALADWRISNEGERTVSVFLDRRVSGEFRFDVLYERLLPASSEDESPTVTVPLLRAGGVNRQRGMVALLASRELTLEPQSEESLTRVGENQLPVFVREIVDMTIAHTFRYFETSPVLLVQATVPDRQRGRFDAEVNTLVSLRDVTTSVAATIDVNVKSGSIMELQLLLPGDVNFLNLSAPSLRTEELEARGEVQVIDVQFTQEMEGQFRIEVLYEWINADSDDEVPVPMIHVVEAEVEHGRLAIEALSAVEVQASTIEHLSTVEIGDLPRQLVQRTPNPILLAFKYVQADPLPALALRVTHHTEIEVQAATIDQAYYRTLITRDGFAVTTALFTVRNSRQQFLRVRLPAGAEVWSATVNEQAETPAMANDGDSGDGAEVLINIINSSQGFPVELIYATTHHALGYYGQIESQLPRPDMVVTSTRWEVYVPTEFEYGEPECNLDIIEQGVYVYDDEMGTQNPQSSGLSNTEQPIRITVPSSGLRFSFERLYVNQTDDVIAISIPYISDESATFGTILSLVATCLLLIGILGLRSKRFRSSPLVLGAIAIGAVGLAIAVSKLGADPEGPGQLAAALIAGLAVSAGYKPLRRWAEKRRARLAAIRKPTPPPASVPMPAPQPEPEPEPESEPEPEPESEPESEDDESDPQDEDISESGDES